MQDSVNILMVDDVVRYQSIYKMAILQEFPNATVNFATNGLQAIEILNQDNSFDLLILDLNMPELGGEETLVRIRKKSQYDNMPILILTGESEANLQHRLLNLGADDFIEKGCDPEIFSGRLNAALKYKLLVKNLTDTAINVDLFAAGVLHDIRNLEASITSICHIINLKIEDFDPTSDGREIIQEFENLDAQAIRLGQYARDIISMVRDKTNALQFEPVDLEEVVNWCKDLLNPTKKVVEFTLKETVPVSADKTLLRLAVFNLIQNSIKFCDKETIHITIFQQTEENSITTYIQDNGPGVHQSMSQDLFKPFTVDPANKDSGFGLGLSLVARVVELLNGKIWVEPSKVGQGATFAIKLGQ